MYNVVYSLQAYSTLSLYFSLCSSLSLSLSKTNLKNQIKAL